MVTGNHIKFTHALHDAARQTESNMAKRNVPTHPQGWKYAGGCGAFSSWHVGKNDYRVTAPSGEVIGRFEQFSPAFHFAARQNTLAKLAA